MNYSSVLILYNDKLSCITMQVRSPAEVSTALVYHSKIRLPVVVVGYVLAFIMHVGIMTAIMSASVMSSGVGTSVSGLGGCLLYTSRCV